MDGYSQWIRVSLRIRSDSERSRLAPERLWRDRGDDRAWRVDVFEVRTSGIVSTYFIIIATISNCRVDSAWLHEQADRCAAFDLGSHRQ
jgi:hypothetical protein